MVHRPVEVVLELRYSMLETLSYGSQTCKVVLELRCSMLETLGCSSQICRSSAGAQVLHAGDFRLRFTDL